MTHKYKTWGTKEHPLYNHFKLCPTARFVGGVSKYLCECKEPHTCKGVRKILKEKEPFRIIPRVAVYDNGDKEPLLFLPDIKANYGNITCYARVGEHSEADILFYWHNTKKPDEKALQLAQWYIKNICDDNDKPRIMKRLNNHTKCWK